MSELKSETAQQIENLRHQRKAEVSNALQSEKSIANLNDRLKTTNVAMEKYLKTMNDTKFFQDQPGISTIYKRANFGYSRLLGEQEAITERLNQLQGLSIKADGGGTSIPTDDSFWDQFSTK